MWQGMYNALKAVAKHEFGLDALAFKGYPEYTVSFTHPDTMYCTLFGRLDRYSNAYVFGPEALPASAVATSLTVWVQLRKYL